RRYDTKAMPAINRVILSLGTGFKEGQKEDHDYSVCEVWAQCDGGFYLLDLWRERVPFPDIKRAVLSLNQRWTPSALLIEESASCQTLIQELGLPAVGPGGSDQPGFIPGQSQGGRFAGQALPVVPINAGNDKIARAAALSSLIEAGLVWLPEDAPWAEDFLHEACDFPVVQHDNHVAAMACALTYLRAAAGKEKVSRQEAQ